MADLDGAYDPNAKPADVWEVIPANDYVCLITESARESSSTGNGDFLKLKLVIVEGEFENRILFDRLNLWNSNQQASEIANRTLASIREATGVMSPKFSEELHNIPILVKVGVRAAGPDKNKVMREAQNTVKGYSRLTDLPPGVAAATSPVKPAQTAPTAPRAAAAAPRPVPAVQPWKRPA